MGRVVRLDPGARAAPPTPRRSGTTRVRWAAWVDGFAPRERACPTSGRRRARCCGTAAPGGRGRVLEQVDRLRGARRPDAAGRGRAPARHPARRVPARRRSTCTSRSSSTTSSRSARRSRRSSTASSSAARSTASLQPHARRLRPRAARGYGVGGRGEPLGSSAHVRLQGRGRRRRRDGRRDRAGDRRRRHPSDPQGRRPALRRHRPREGPRGHRERQAAKLVNKGKLTQEQGDAQVARILGNITGTTSYDGFGDVDFVIEAVPEKMEIKHQVFADLDAVTPGHADPRLQHLRPLDHRDRRRHAAPRQGRRLPLLLARLVHAPDRGDRGRRDLAGDRPGRDRRSPSRSARCRSARPSAPASSSTASSSRPRRRSGATRTRPGCPVEQIDEFIKEHAQMPMGPFRVADMCGLDTVVKVARDMRRRLRRPLLRAQGHGGAARARRPRRQDREGLL